MQNLVDFLRSGGPVMVPIGLSALVGLAWALQRGFALRRGNVSPKGFAVEVLELLKQDRFADAVTLCKKADCAAGVVVEAAVAHRGRPRAIIKERVEEIGRQQAAGLEAGADVVGTVATVAPLLGLLGTVWGMILTFEVIQEQGMGVMGSLAGGISQALITTMAGLTVGIPAVIAHRAILAAVDRRVLELEDLALQVLDLVAAPEVAHEPQA